MAWGHRIGREIETDASNLSSIALILSELERVDKPLLESMISVCKKPRHSEDSRSKAGSSVGNTENATRQAGESEMKRI